MKTGRPRQAIQMAASAEELYDLYRKEKDGLKRRRYQFAYELKRGTSIDAAAQQCGIGGTTADTWVAWLRQGGLAELTEGHGWGGQRHVGGRLSEEQEGTLIQEAVAGKIRSIHDGVAWAKRRCKVDYTYWGMRGVFTRLGLSKKVPRPANIKRNDTRQTAWREGAVLPAQAGRRQVGRRDHDER
jgi:transposase